MKKDPKQMTFDIPHSLMPLTRQIFYRRYVCDVAGTAGYQVDWLDEGTNPTRTIHVEDSNDISIVPTDLPSQDLFRTKIQVNCDTVKLVTITIFYSTGTVLVQGNRCPRWRDEEFSSLIKYIRAIYAFVDRDRVKEPELHETVTTNLRNLRLPTVSPSPTGEPGLHDVRPRCSPRPQLPRTTGSTRRSSRRLQALSPKSASPSAAPVPVSQHIKPTRHLDHTRATPSYHTTPARHTPPASLPSHTFTTPRLPSHWAGDSKTTDKGRAQAACEGEVWPTDWHRDVTDPKADGGHKTEQRHEISNRWS